MSSQRSRARRPMVSDGPSSIDPTSTSRAPRRSSAYDRDFEQKLRDHNVYMPTHRDKPENWQEIHDALGQPRPSLSPSRFSDGAFERFCEAQEDTRDERDVVAEVLPTILGSGRRQHPSAGDVVFGNMEELAPEKLTRPKPDLYYGTPLSEINQRVRRDLHSQIVPSTQTKYPAVPNFFLEAKGPNGSAAVKARQACYDGAVGARAMHALQGYGKEEPVYDNSARTISATYHDGTLKMYSHHLVPPSDSDNLPGFRMAPLRSWALTDSPQTYREGVGAFRNGRDLAKEQRRTLLDEASTVSRSMPATDLTRSSNLDGSRRRRTQEQDQHARTRTVQDRPPDVQSRSVNSHNYPDLSRSNDREQAANRRRPTLPRVSESYDHSLDQHDRSRPIKEFFIAVEGISEAVIQAYTNRYCGRDARVSITVSEVRCKAKPLRLD